MRILSIGILILLMGCSTSEDAKVPVTTLTSVDKISEPVIPLDLQRDQDLHPLGDHLPGQGSKTLKLHRSITNSVKPSIIQQDGTTNQIKPEKWINF